MADLLTGESLMPPTAIWVKAQIPVGLNLSFLFGQLLASTENS